MIGGRSIITIEWEDDQRSISKVNMSQFTRENNLINLNNEIGMCMVKITQYFRFAFVSMYGLYI
jgi:hypothetical protein